MADNTVNTNLNFNTNASNAKVEVDALASSIAKTGNTSNTTAKSIDNLSGTFKKNGDAVLENGGAMGLLNDLTGGYAMMVKDAVEALELFTTGKKVDTAATNTNTVATKAGVVATESMTIAQKAFNIVANANPYILLATAIISLTGAAVYYIKSTNEQAAALKKLTDQSEKTSRATKDLEDNIKSQANSTKNANDIEILRAKSLGATTGEIRELIKQQDKLAISTAETNRLRAIANEQAASTNYNNAVANGNEELIKMTKEAYKKAQELTDQWEETLLQAKINKIKDGLNAKIEANAEEAALAEKAAAAKQKAQDIATTAEQKRVEGIQKTRKEYADKTKFDDEGINKAEVTVDDLIDKIKTDGDKVNEAKKELMLKDLENQAAISKMAVDNAQKEEDEKKRIKQVTSDAILDMTQSAGDIVLAINSLNEGKSKKAQAKSIKLQGAVNLAMIGANTAAGIMNALGTSTNTYEGVIRASAVGVAGIAQAVANAASTKKALSSLGESGGGGGSAPSSGPAASAMPNVSFVSSSENQLQQSINTKNAEQSPIKAYVVASDVTNQQVLDEKIKNKTTM